MKILERITTSLSFVILAVCCGALLLFGISKTGWRVLSIPTGSMRPTIPPGSLVLVHHVPVTSLNVGDVITYINPLNPKTTISHRIIKKYLIDGKVPAFITKGDANKTADIPITIGSVEGKVIGHVGSVGGWLQTIKQPIVVLPIVYLAALLVIVEEVARLRDYFKHNQPYFLRGSMHREVVGRKQAAFVISLIGVLIIIGLASGQTVLALLRSDTVALVSNSLSVAPANNQCNGSSNNSITINNTSTQTATSGNATSSSGGNSATTGNATNNNSTNINVTIKNC